jgi:hypothetical protein
MAAAAWSVAQLFESRIITLPTKLDHEMEVANQTFSMATVLATVKKIMGICDPILQSEGALTTATATSLPSSPTLQGIPRELRDKIYHEVAAIDRTISVRGLLKSYRQGKHNGDLWKQFQSFVAGHPLSMTCRQMRTELDPIFANTAGATYHFVVDNFDLEQLALYNRFVCTYCFRPRISDTNFPPLLYKEVGLRLKLDCNVFESTHIFCNVLASQRHCYAFTPESLSSIMSVSVCDLTSMSSMTEAQAKRTRGMLRRLYEPRSLRSRDASAAEVHLLGLLVAQLNSMVDTLWPSTTTVKGSPYKSL